MADTELPGPVVGGLYLRDAASGTIATVKDLDEGQRQVLVTFPHDTVDSYKTTFSPECFRDSFEAEKPVMCWQHDLRDPIGRAVKAQVLTRSNELVGQFSNFDAVPNAFRAYSQIDDGTIDNFSFGFREPKYRAHPRYRGVREISHAFMKEFSPVTIGSIPGAKATGLREDELMAEHTVAEITELVEKKIISPEEGRRMLAELDGYRQHLTTTTVAPVAGADDEAAAAAAAAEELRNEPPLPEVLNATAILGTLPETWQRKLAEADAKLHLTIGDEQLRTGDDGDEFERDENEVTLASGIDAALESARGYFGEVAEDKITPELRQAIDLIDAAAVSSTTLLEIMGVDVEAQRAAAAENMASVPVKCEQCNGSGEVDGKVCPRCDGSGVEAQQRAIPDDAPKGSKPCPTCKGTGKMLQGHMKCKTCGGKGYLTPEQASDLENRAAPDTWSEKPWEGFTAAKYTPEEWRSACLIVKGDGATKADCALPIKEPDGTYNVNGIRAAAGRIDQVDASEEDKTRAADTLADLYGTMKADVPPEVAKLRSRSDDEVDTEPSPEELQAELDHRMKRLARHGEPATV